MSHSYCVISTSFDPRKSSFTNISINWSCQLKLGLIDRSCQSTQDVYSNFYTDVCTQFDPFSEFHALAPKEMYGPNKAMHKIVSITSDPVQIITINENVHPPLH